MVPFCWCDLWSAALGLIHVHVLTDHVRLLHAFTSREGGRGGLPVSHAVCANAAWSGLTWMMHRYWKQGVYPWALPHISPAESPELSVWKMSIFLRPVYHLCSPHCVGVYSTGWLKIWTWTLRAWVTKSGLWDKYLVCEMIHQSLSSHILVCGFGSKYSDISSWTNPSFMFSGNFLLGTLILSSSHFNTKVILLLCCKSPLSWLSASTGGNRKRFKDERHNSTTDNKELAEMLISSSLCHVRDQLQYPPFCQFCHVLLLYCVECRTLKWHICLSCAFLTFAFLLLVKNSTNREPLVLLLYMLGAKVL